MVALSGWRSRRPWAAFAIAIGLVTAASLARADDWHVEPGASGNGTEAAPFGSLSEALAAAAGGDRILLHTGDYGDALIEGSFDTEVVVTAADAATPRLRTLEVRNASKVAVRGLSISLSYGEPYATDEMVHVAGTASDVAIESCEIFSVPDADTASWSAADWASLPGTGIGVRAPRVAIRGNRVRNVGYGISIAHDAPNALVAGNLVENFSRDGLRGIGDYGVFEYNVVKNAYDVDDHHDDFFQSWSVGTDGTPGAGVVRGVVLRGNTFINFDDPDQPFAGAAQGIGCFDGFFEDWVIENNVVIVNHWHGITLLGARNARIVNNTVLDNRLGETPGPPWIMVAAHKDGTPSENILIRNNLAQTITLEANASTQDNNLEFADPAALFVDVAAHDLHLVEASAAVDVGSAEMAPALDHDRIPRPQGAGFDLGAYEWHDGSVEPVGDAGPSAIADAGPAGGGADGGGSSGAAAGGCGCRSAGPDSRRSAWQLCLLGTLLLVALGRARRRRAG